MASDITFNINISGLSETIAGITRMKDDVIPVLSKTLNKEHEKIMTEAKMRTPVDTGALRASGVVMPPVVYAGIIKSVGQFGGVSVDYALKVHEDLAVIHNVGRSKYYESASLDGRDRLENAVEEALNELIESR